MWNLDVDTSPPHIFLESSEVDTVASPLAANDDELLKHHHHFFFADDNVVFQVGLVVDRSQASQLNTVRRSKTLDSRYIGTSSNAIQRSSLPCLLFPEGQGTDHPITIQSA